MIERIFIKQGIRKIELENYLKKELNKAGFTGLDIVKTPLVTRIVLHVSRPGLAIGKAGQNIKQLTETMGKKFGIDNPQLEIQEVRQADLNATAIVNRVAALLERGYSWRSVAFRTMRDITSAGAQGMELVLAGKLAGKGGRKRKQRIAEGYMKKVGDQTKLVDYAKATAYPKAGAIGIKLRIIKPGVVFSDKIDVKEAVEAIEKKEAEKEVTEKTAEKEKEVEEKEPEGKGEKPAKEGKKETNEKQEKKKKEKAGKEKKGKTKGKSGKKEKVKEKKEEKSEKAKEKADEKKEKKEKAEKKEDQEKEVKETQKEGTEKKEGE